MVGKVDGVFSSSTRHGLIAFQKVEGLKRSGIVDSATTERLASAAPPAPKYTTPADHLEVDIARQVVFVVRGGGVAWVLPTSTGNNKLFTSEGWTRRAVTPNGVFKINRKINGMRISPLGELYKPSYFNGGIAFHGNPSVPTGPASHGCVRLPMPFATWFFESASPIGQTVYVYGGPSGDNPQPTIEDAPAPMPTVEEPLPSPPADPAPVPSPTDPNEPEPSPEPEAEEEDEEEDEEKSPDPDPTASFPFNILDD
jgi:peptidoglycan hydrolase-like protein with peptidoglycan-binding domain